MTFQNALPARISNDAPLIVDTEVYGSVPQVNARL